MRAEPTLDLPRSLSPLVQRFHRDSGQGLPYPTPSVSYAAMPAREECVPNRRWICLEVFHLAWDVVPGVEVLMTPGSEKSRRCAHALADALKGHGRRSFGWHNWHRSDRARRPIAIHAVPRRLFQHRAAWTNVALQ
jgi:hypothetical protein